MSDPGPHPWRRSCCSDPFHAERGDEETVRVDEVSPPSNEGEREDDPAAQERCPTCGSDDAATCCDNHEPVESDGLRYSERVALVMAREGEALDFTRTVPIIERLARTRSRLTQVIRERDELRELVEYDHELRVRLETAESERDEARTHSAQWEGSFQGMVGVEKELRGRLEAAESQVSRLRELATEWENMADTDVLEDEADTLRDCARHLRALLSTQQDPADQPHTEEAG